MQTRLLIPQVGLVISRPCDDNTNWWVDAADILIEAEVAFFRDVARCRAGCNTHFASNPPVSRDHRFRDEYATLEQTRSAPLMSLLLKLM